MVDEHTHIVDHPFVIDSLGHLRDQRTELAVFRRYSDQICHFLFAEAMRGLEFETKEIVTPLEVGTQVKRLKDEIIIVPVLRSGLAMLFGALQLLPKAKVGFIGLQRDEQTAVAHEYYWNAPAIRKRSVVIVTDPMVATGGSVLHLLRRLAPYHPKEIRVVCVVAAPEGIRAIRQEFPNIEIFTAAVDSHLNDNKFIVPGIGDYGDRYFGTSV